MDVQTEWQPCGNCGEPVIMHDGFQTDVFVFGQYGEIQVDEGVEHECR